MTRFDEMLKFVLKWEGGYSNVAGDRGGATNFGIIQTEYNAYRKRKGLMVRGVKYITVEEYTEIYKTEYLDKGAAGSATPNADILLLDTAVNMGITTSIRVAQQALGITVDGLFGPNSKAFLTAATKTPAGMQQFLTKYVRLREQRYRNIATGKDQAQFLKGWLNRLRDLATTQLGLVVAFEDADDEVIFNAKAYSVYGANVWEPLHAPDGVTVLLHDDDDFEMEEEEESPVVETEAEEPQITIGPTAKIADVFASAVEKAYATPTIGDRVLQFVSNNLIDIIPSHLHVGGSQNPPSIDLGRHVQGRLDGNGVPPILTSGAFGGGMTFNAASDGLVVSAASVEDVTAEVPHPWTPDNDVEDGEEEYKVPADGEFSLMSVFRPLGLVCHLTSSKWGDAAAVRQWHKDKGWSDIGYHAVILNGYRSYPMQFNTAVDGKIEPGRPESIRGAHCLAGGMNNCTLGVSCVGTPGFLTPSGAGPFAVTPKVPYLTPNQAAALVHWLAVKCKQYDIDPLGTFKHPVTGKQTPTISQHSQWDSGKPDCASLNISAVRAAVAHRLKG